MLPAVLLAALFYTAPLAAGPGVQPACATTEQARNIRDYYSSMRPGVPLPVPSRYFNVTEFVVASALPPEQALGASATPEIVKQIWATIEGWGAATKVTLVLSPNSRHAFAFPSLVPTTQPNPKSGYMDVYADDGRGVHSHIQLDQVAAIYATDVPAKNPASRTRGISFFGPNGDLVLGVYASINQDSFDAKAVEGFARSWSAIADLPRLCAG
ncbi:MAG: hypothetical protein DI568_01250 [Sphingomonas sp.]|nr:MAG: hypothetical protein DI568_01250 [Sphingomonas sp.]